MSDEDVQLRTSQELWRRLTRVPNSPLAPLPVQVADSARLLDGQWVTFGSDSGWERRPLADEVVLRGLVSLDLADVDALLAFFVEHGFITLPASEVLPPAMATYGLGWKRVEEINESRPPHRSLVHVDELRLCLRVMRALVGHWSAATSRRLTLPSWETEDLGHLVVDEEQAWSWFVSAVNAGVKTNPPRLELALLYDFADVVIGAPQAGLYSAMCIQLYNLMVEDIPPKKCGNENCDNLFVRQHGRSTAQRPQFRTRGVAFCTFTCAKAQNQRDRRRRQRANQGEANA